jgi:hypothetical protein
MLPAELSARSGDSHPNADATNIATPKFVKETFDAALRYEKKNTAISLTIRVQFRLSKSTKRCNWKHW